MSRSKRFLIYCLFALPALIFFQAAIIMDHTATDAGQLGFTGILWTAFALIGALVVFEPK